MRSASVPAQVDEATQRAPARLVVHSMRAADPGDLIAQLPGPADALAWTSGGEGLVGWGTAARITLPAGHDRFAAGEKWLRELTDGALVADEVAVPGSGLVAFGSFTFDPTSDGSMLIVPRTIIGRRDGAAWVTSIAVQAGNGDRRSQADNGDRRSQAGNGHRPSQADAWSHAHAWPAANVPLTEPSGVRWSDGSLTAPQWERAVSAAVAAIRAGKLRKVVLALELHAHATAAIDARVLLARLADRYPDCYTFACGGLVGATPELLIKRTGNELHSLVLAGTMSRGGTTAADDTLGATLLASAKNREEHQYAVADVRQALQPLCADLRIDDRPFLLRLANVQHLATRVRGKLADGDAAHSALALAAALHPTAAVCGTPAEAAMELIRELEGMDRGRYSGPVGWVDGRGNGEWGIALRCGELAGDDARLVAGCGIVAGSDPTAELAEAQSKFWPMRYALEG